MAAGDHPAADAYLAELRLSDLAAAERRQEAARLRYVLDGLPERDREVLNLAFRHDLTARDVAAILTISSRRSRRLLARAASSFEQRSITVILTRQGWVGCLALDKVAGDPEDTQAPLTPRLCRRVARHSRRCVVCGQIAANWAFGPESLGLLPLAAPPAALAGASAGLAAGYPVAAPPWIERPARHGAARGTRSR